MINRNQYLISKLIAYLYFTHRHTLNMLKTWLRQSTSLSQLSDYCFIRPNIFSGLIVLKSLSFFRVISA